MPKNNNVLENSHMDTVPELLVPAGDFDCVRAGVQNGADCIYLGANIFSARANAKNFSLEELKEVIEYCKIRNVKTNLTLNTLITDSEFADAVLLAKNAYEFGIDAIIVQDLGLGKYLIDNFPNLEVHASTQMSVHNLEGVLELEKLGFSRVVLSREVPINEIEYIRNNCKVDLEIFIHGALCISYSGQCLFSSLVGGRSGNRGKCAQPCRLPYELIEKNSKDENTIDKGYLLSPRDLCSLENLPTLVKLGVNSFKIEGRMKTPEYVATVTRIYRKYIDMALSSLNDGDFVIDEKDKKELLQVFNRGGFSTGHQLSTPNKNLIYKEKPNNIGLYLGNIANYNANKGHITIKLNEKIAIGDCISIEGETGKYTISELMKGNSNIKNADSGAIVKLGRMKGKIRAGLKVYKLSSKTLSDECKVTYSENKEIKKIPISCYLNVKKNLPISLSISANVPPFYNNIYVDVVSDIIPEDSVKSPVDATRLKEQLSKLGNTPYRIETIHIDLDENLHIPSISGLNSLRRTAIEKLENAVLNNFHATRDFNVIRSLNITNNSETLEKSNVYDETSNATKILDTSSATKTTNSVYFSDIQTNISSTPVCKKNTLKNKKISLLIESINTNLDYSKISGADNIYLPLKFFSMKKYTSKIQELSELGDLYIYMPTIIKANYKNLLLNTLENILETYEIKGFIVSNIAGFEFLKSYIENYKIIANYTLNVFNKNSVNELKKLGTNVITPSIELNKIILQDLCINSSLPVEIICYGRSILMNSSYCLLGKSNKCYPECKMKCSGSSKFYLKDRMGFNFRIMPDNIQTVTSIYNSKITSIDTYDLPSYSLRANILDENIDEINKIIVSCKDGKKLEGKEYTNGNLNRII